MSNKNLPKEAWAARAVLDCQQATDFITETALEKNACAVAREHRLIIEECCLHLNVCETKVRLVNGWL